MSFTRFVTPLLVRPQSHTEWQWPISCVHSITRVKSAHPGEGVGARRTPISFYYHHVQSSSVRSIWEGRYTIPISPHPYMYSTLWVTARLDRWRNLARLVPFIRIHRISIFKEAYAFYLPIPLFPVLDLFLSKREVAIRPVNGGGGGGSELSSANGRQAWQLNWISKDDGKTYLQIHIFCSACIRCFRFSKLVEGWLALMWTWTFDV